MNFKGTETHERTKLSKNNEKQTVMWSGKIQVIIQIDSEVVFMFARMKTDPQILTIPVI